MARRSARFAEKLAKSSPVKIADTPVKKKTTIREYFKAPDPYVSIEKLDIESPQKKLLVKQELKHEPEPSLDDSSESDGSDGSDYQDGISSTRKKSSKENKNQNGRQTNTALSEYEKQIQQNIEERKKMFQELVGAAKDDFMNIISAENKEKKKAVQRGLKRKVDER